MVPLRDRSLRLGLRAFMVQGFRVLGVAES